MSFFSLLLQTFSYTLIEDRKKEENFISSDINAILPHTKDVIFLDDGHCALVSKTDIQIKDKNNKVIEGNPDAIKTVNDVWKFSKNMWSQDPTWYLVDTSTK